jgi:hypothetical protein
VSCVDVTFEFAKDGHSKGDHTFAWSSGYATSSSDGYSYSYSSSWSSDSSGGSDFNSSSSPTTGSHGNIRTYTEDGITVNASAFSRTNGGTWQTAYLGAYSEGLGVTDRSESGGSGSHRVDNVGRWNYVLFEFSDVVNIDRGFLDSIDGDSDIQIWIGTVNDPIQNHQTLSDSFLAGLGFTEFNNTANDDSRWADFNAGGVLGNILVIAASPASTHKDDQFKISKLDVCAEPVKFYVADASAGQTFEYGRGGESLANSDLASGNGNARGVATTTAGNQLWVIDGNHQVYVYDSNGNLRGSWTALGLAQPEDITTDGTHIWILDNGPKQVLQYSNAAGRLDGSQSPDNSFTLTAGGGVVAGATAVDAASYVALRKMSSASSMYDPNFGSTTNVVQNGTLPPEIDGTTTGIVTNGQHFWVVSDGIADKVYKYALDGEFVGSWFIDANNGNPTGITLDPSNVSHLWIVDGDDDAVYRYNDGTNRSSGDQSADRVFLLAGGNGDPQGIADPPPNVLEPSWEPVAEAYHVQTQSRESTTTPKDRVLADWAMDAKSDTRQATHRPARRQADEASRGVSLRPWLQSQLIALDAAFGARNTDKNTLKDGHGYGEEPTTPSKVAENVAEAAVAGIGSIFE